MAEPTDTATATPASGLRGTAQAAACRCACVGQYIKDLSFENPNVRKLLDGQRRAAEPARRGQRQRHQDGATSVFESAIEFKAEATNKAGVIYDLELAYAGLFEIENMPEQALEPFLLINCPSLLFPVPAPPGGRPDARRRLPAAAARPDRFRRAVHAAAAAGRPGHQAQTIESRGQTALSDGSRVSCASSADGILTASIRATWPWGRAS